MTYQFIQSFQVRDYECDLQGIVNNAVYQNYMEHTRHEFLLSRGIDFAALTAEGIDLVVVRAEIDYRKPLRPGDRIYVGLNGRMKDRVRFEFEQVIHLESDDSVCTSARIIGTGMNAKGRPGIPKDLVAKLFN